MRGQILFRCQNCGQRIQGPVMEGVEVEMKTCLDTEHAGIRQPRLHSCKDGEEGIIMPVGRKEDHGGKSSPHG